MEQVKERAKIRARHLLQRFRINSDGNFAVIGAIGLMLALSLIGLGGNLQSQIRSASRLQDTLDLAVLSGASLDGTTTQKLEMAQSYFANHIDDNDTQLQDVSASFALVDGNVVKGDAQAVSSTLFNFKVNQESLHVSATASAIFEQEESNGACLHILGNSAQALLINSGADIIAPECEVHVHSMQNPAFIMNAGSTLDVKNLCVAGTQYIKNGGFISNWETACDVQPDPYAGAIAEPAVGSCTTSNVQDGNFHSLAPGVHCNVTFNGSPTIVFQPGLHIIKGRMIANSGSNITAEGVTFYFPNTDSEIRANGNLTMIATAPTTGTYKDVLMFEKTSDSDNNTQKRQYIFNGSNSEHLEGVIYLPNRDVTYNSTTNITANRTVMVFNTLIMNSANWDFAGVSAGMASGAPTAVRLIH